MTNDIAAAVEFHFFPWKNTEGRGTKMGGGKALRTEKFQMPTPNC
jgi:hypothetical protein